MKSKSLSLLLTIFFLPTILFGIEAEITTIGTLYPSSKSCIGSQVTGRVDKVLIEVGATVKKGQPIVQIDSRPFEITVAQRKAALESAKIELVHAETDFLRMQKLWEKPEGETPSIPLKRFEDAKSKYAQALVVVKQAEENLKEAKLDLDESTIKAPFDGIVTKKLVDIGESLPSIPVTHVAEIQCLNPLYLEFSIPQNYQNHISEGSPITFEIDGMQLQNNTTKIHLIYPSLDESTRSLRCRAIIDNSEQKMRPGSIVKVTVKTALPEVKMEGNKS